MRPAAVRSSDVRPSPPLPSDRALAAAVSSGDTAAFSRLYDRYARLVFSLACASRPADAEAIIEAVFAEVWWLARRSELPLPLAPLWIELVARRITSAPASSALPLGLPALLPFTALDPSTLHIFLMAYLGQLDIREIAAAVEIDQPGVKQALARGLSCFKAAAGVESAAATLGASTPAAG